MNTKNVIDSPSENSTNQGKETNSFDHVSTGLGSSIYTADLRTQLDVDFFAEFREYL